MPPRRSTRGSASSGAADADAAKTSGAAAPSTLDVDSGGNGDDHAVAFTPGRLSPSAYLERKEATTRAQLAR